MLRYLTVTRLLLILTAARALSAVLGLSFASRVTEVAFIDIYKTIFQGNVEIILFKRRFTSSAF